MMTGLQQQRPWGVTALTRSVPQPQHGCGADRMQHQPKPQAAYAPYPQLKTETPAK